MPGVPREYIGLMRDAMKESGSSSSPSSQRPLKKRKRNRRDLRSESVESASDANSQGDSLDRAIVVENSGDESSSSSAQRRRDLNAIPVIDLSDRESRNVKFMTPNDEPTYNDAPSEMNVITVDDDDDDDEDDEDDYEDDDFEDVDLENVKPRASSNLTGDVSIKMNKEDLVKKKKTKVKNVVDKEERVFRRQFHRNYISIMSIHGFVRNRWCNNKLIHSSLMKLISPSVYDELHPSKEVEMPQIRTRRFLDGLRHLVDRWSKYYKVTSNKGIYKHDWYDWYGYDKSKFPFSRFVKCITKGRGNRDVGAQGFVALLRAAGVPSRLVFSLQPPDFTSMAIKKKPETEQSQITKVGAKSTQDKLLELRKGKISTTVDQPTQGEIELKYPVFWAEAWDSASKVWITIDPIQFKIIENVRSKSKLEPPSNYQFNNLVYVLGYDRKGGVRDITKRYAEKYYARTRKKRITKDESDEIWYTDFLGTLSTRERNRADDYEDEYFEKKATLEGMPDNIQDFKNHPFYVLESHLKSNEILFPKEHCGMIRTKGKNSSIKVYKRENVQLLRSPRAWFQRGRVLKTGERPMMVRNKTPAQMKDDDDDPEERLYAIFQTSLYIPPPVEDGLITKNSYGNIDAYVPSMIPEGAVLIKTPFAQDAAKLIGIDYAPAVVGFKFERRGATPKIEGVVVAEEFKEAVESVQEQLKNEAIEKEKLELEIRALKGWALLFAKLRIRQRLNAHHGKVDEEGDQSEDEYNRLEKEYEEYLENDESDDDEMESDGDNPKSPEYGPGGFIIERNGRQPRYEADDFMVESNQISDSGGFMKEDSANYNHQNDDFSEVGTEPISDSGGGFLNEVYDDEGEYYDPNDSDGELYHTAGGFIPEDHTNHAPETSDQKENPPNDNVVERDSQIPENHDESDGMDEYEAFFDQLQNNENDDVDEESAIDSSQPSKVTETVETLVGSGPYPVTEVEKLPAIEPNLEETIGQADEESLKENSTEAQENEDPQNISSHAEIDEPKSIEEYDSDLEKEFTEQLIKEKYQQNLSQSTQGGSAHEEDYEFDYDSE